MDMTKHEINNMPNTYHRILTMENGYAISIICNTRSVGGTSGLFEVAVKHGDHMCYATPITDNVIGWVSFGSVSELIKDVSNLPVNDRCDHMRRQLPTDPIDPSNGGHAFNGVTSSDDSDSEGGEATEPSASPSQTHDAGIHEWGKVEYARFTGNPHRRCKVCNEITLDLEDYDDDGVLGNCGCVDYHYADCPTRQPDTTDYLPDYEDYEEDDYGYGE